MSDLRKAAEQALSALEAHGQMYPHMVKSYCVDAICELRAALAEPEQSEPVAAIHIGWDYLDNGKMVATYAVPVNEQVAPRLYAAPPHREPLTDEQVKKATGAGDEYWASSKLFIVAIARAIEQAHGIGEKT